ncbi:MAG: hypothetical protein DYG89_08860 [Caldilinea sp. CFX5]|nr:hypothetical protein [Caldilinea sp. CFX5]
MVQTAQPSHYIWTSPNLHRWLLPLAAILILAGYFGPWVPHRVAGLVVTGLDLGEYVKFLPTVRGGQITLWREGFYLPLVAVSLALSLAAFRPQWRYGWPMRVLLLIIAGIAALNLLPPAWGPATFTNPEFRQQIGALALCLGAAAISPFLALLPRWVGSSIVLLLGTAALRFPLRDFLRVLPTIRELYNEPLSIGWGVYVMVIGLLLLIVVQVVSLLDRKTITDD